MTGWKPYPMLRMLVPFLLGITIQLCLEISLSLNLVFLIAAFCGLFLAYWATLKSFSAHAFGLAAFVFLVAAGMWNTGRRIQEVSRRKISGKALYIGKVMDRPVERTASCRVPLLVMPVDGNGLFSSRNAMVHGYLPVDPVTHSLAYGDMILFNADIRDIPPPMNPGEFNYCRYLFRRGVTGQVFLASSGDWQKIGRKEGPMLKAGILHMRYSLIDRLSKYIGAGDEFRVLGALTLGYRQELDAEIRQDFAAAGAMHFLAISGLHVGILFFIFHTVLAFMERVPHGKIIRAFMVLILLWLYASLTGLSPSVTRAVAMFSFFTIGRSFNRQVNTFNIIASSAFLLLLINPFLLTDVGFQLSYLAVSGIVFFQPRLSALWKPPSWFLKHVWTLTTVALSAQLVAFPLTAWYFHIFPNYFILSNLLVLPLVTLLLSSGVLFFLLGHIHFLAAGLGWFLKNTTWLMNSLVKTIHALPGSTLEPVYHSLPEVILLYMLLSSITGCLLFRKKFFFSLSLLILLALTGSKQWRKIVRIQQEKLVVYHSPGHSVVGMIRGREMWMFHPSDSLERFDYSTKNHRISSGADRVKYPGSLSKEILETAGIIRREEGYFLLRKNKCLLVLDRCPEGVPENGKAMEIDILVVSRGGRFPLKAVENWFSPRLIVLDSSVRREQALKWQDHFLDRGIGVYPVITGGAFIHHL